MANPLKPWSQRPYDSALGDQTNAYLDWVTSALNTLIGQANAPLVPGLPAVKPNLIDMSAGQLVSVGSRPQSFTSPLAFVSVASPGSVSFYWDGTNGSTPLTIYRDDNTTLGPFKGSLIVTGLTAGSTYFFYPFFQDGAFGTDNLTGELPNTVNWPSLPGAVGTPAVAYATRNVIAYQRQYLRDHIPLASSLNTTGITIPASGSGSGSGGSGGGGSGGRGIL